MITFKYKGISGTMSKGTIQWNGKTFEFTEASDEMKTELWKVLDNLAA